MAARMDEQKVCRMVEVFNHEEISTVEQGSVLRLANSRVNPNNMTFLGVEIVKFHSFTKDSFNPKRKMYIFYSV